MTGELQIDYDTLAQEAQREAMLSIVRTVLQRVAGWGRLPGEHHFYIAFDTRAPGVVVSKRLKQKYPEEMTIVLQHQFRNLLVDDERFEVTLSFDNVPERLTVPFRAVRVFFDPSVPYGLQLDSSDPAAGRTGAEAEAVPGVADAGGGDRKPGSGQAAGRDAAEPAAPAKVRSPRKPRAVQGEAAGEGPAQISAVTDSPATEEVTGRRSSAVARSPASRPTLAPAQAEEPANDAKVVQLDKFRKR